MICLLLVIMVVFINGIENAEQKVKHLHTVLKEEDIDAKTKAWLLMVESGRVDNEEMRRITPKSIFIAPLLTNPGTKCKEGYRYDHLGQCVKVFQPDPKMQLELLLKKLNKLYSGKKEEEEQQEDSNKRLSEPSNGPLQFSIPVSLNVDKGAPSSESNIKSESLEIIKMDKMQMEHNKTSTKFDLLGVDDMFQKMQLKDNQTFSNPGPLGIGRPFESEKLQIKNNQPPSTPSDGSTEASYPQFSNPVPPPVVESMALPSSNVQIYPPKIDGKLPAPEKTQILQHHPPPLPVNRLNEMLINRPHYFSSPEHANNDSKNIKSSGSDTKPRPFGFYNKFFTYDTPQLRNNFTMPAPISNTSETLKNGSPVSVSVDKNVNVFNLETRPNINEENYKPLVVQEESTTTDDISSVLFDEQTERNGSLFPSLPQLVNNEKDLDMSFPNNKSDSEEVGSIFFTTENVDDVDNYNYSDPFGRLNSSLNEELMQISTPDSINTERSTMFNFDNTEEPTEAITEFFESKKIPEEYNETSSVSGDEVSRMIENEGLGTSTPVPFDVENNATTTTESNVKSNPALVDKLSVVPENTEKSKVSPDLTSRLNGKFSLSFLAEPTSSTRSYNSTSRSTDTNLPNSAVAQNASAGNDKPPVQKRVQIENNNLPIPLNRLNGTFRLSLLAEPSQEPLQFSIPVSINVEKDVKSTNSDAIVKRLNGTFSLLIG